ncbi:glycine-rich RNA-binding protein 5, mitochondrial-like isoform X3 [Arachis ipaensis]|uniref:glycine-rich RNA-binding protein 5, mitochondrial-like isoform X3 n=1 Tax=Arachis ipaensis TaxID=130454 RepID=UPI0007AFCE51|nr:glycine-rich RNA-binding protein 5, mitochondrial-like isoform X3 [Arachis ipaensis]
MKMREREGSKAELVSVIASTAFTAAVTTIAQENPPQQGKERVSYSTDEQSLREVFGKYGDVVDARIIVDRDFGRSRGFGFITYSSVEEV